MAQTFWTGSNLSFTNGSKIVTVNTGPSVDSIYPNSKLKSGNYNEPVEVKAAYGSTIELYENWPGSTANTSATVTPSSAAAAAAGVAAQQVVTEIQNLVGSASATATANSFVKRDSNGRIKAAIPSANDDVVTKGFIRSAAVRDVGTATGNVMEVGAFGIGAASVPAFIPTSDIDDNTTAAGLYRVDSSVTGVKPSGGSFGALLITRYNSTECSQFFIGTNGSPFTRFYTNTNGWSPWREIYHSGNTNFNEFGGARAGASWLAQGFVRLPNVYRFIFPLNSTSLVSSFSFDGTTSDLSVFVPSTGVSIDLTGSTLNLVTFDSNKLGIIEVREAPTLPEGVQLYLNVNNGKKITFNF